ncbi:MAG: fluoride efflux transporter CrcB [Candidatus Eremiobacteraeota bacterium]|uniref:Putative Camphor resistance CrcB protein n=1 Tax=mine drainage metagenome TaxID=410659 RepID=E6PF54_9ZZZZ|nr:fluoride efflux transporter CrcB [Candidatus Eremiobacteraeota bacterium]
MGLKAILAVALGGGLGSALRYIVNFLVVARFGPGFPLGTLLINMTGSLLIGVVAELAATSSLGMSPLLRLFLAVGVLGGYTTFSTFALDTVTLVGDRALGIATMYALGSVALGVLAAFAGQVLVRFAIR